MNVSGKTEAFEIFEILRNFVVMENFGRIWGGPQVLTIGPHFEHFRFLSLHVSPDCFAFLMTKAKAPKNDSSG